MRTIKFVIMGEEYLVDAADFQKVKSVRDYALQATRNIGRPASEFQIRSSSGELISPDTLVADLPKGEIFLSPCCGWGS